MKVVYVHASRFGNGAQVANEFRDRMADYAVEVEVYHVRELKPRDIPPADLYVFSSPGRIGRPLGSLRRFLAKLQLTPGTRYGLLTTEMGPQADKKTGVTPSEEEFAKWERVRPILKALLGGKGLVLVAEDRVRVTGITGPLEEGWQRTVQYFVDRLLASDAARQDTPTPR